MFNYESIYKDYLPSLKWNGSGLQAMALCPFHADHNPSFSVNLRNGLFKCFACGVSGNHNQFVEKLGVNHKTQSITDTYKYKNNNSEYIKYRVEPLCEKKYFYFTHVEGRKKIKGRGCEPILYNELSITQAIDIIFVEGERKVDWLNEQGFTATCLDSGANSPWNKSYTAILKDKNIVILPDNDTAGKGYANTIAKNLYGVVKEIKIVQLPGLAEAEDIIDWVKLPSNDADKLEELINGAPAWNPEANTNNKNLKPLKASELMERIEERVDWIWETIIYAGILALLVAYMKVGKSVFVYQFIMKAVRGLPFLGFNCKKTAVLIIALEEHHRDVKMRLKELGMTAEDEIYIHFGPLQNNQTTIEELKEYITTFEIGILVIDTLSLFWGIEDENDNARAIKALSPLLNLARETNCAIILIHHERKSGGENGRSVRGAGSLFGLVDQLLILDRRHGGTKTQRTLKIQGRYSESPDELILDFVDGQYESLGDPENVDRESSKKCVIKLLSETGGGMTVPAIVEALKGHGLKEFNIRETLIELENEQIVIKGGHGRRGDPYIYSLMEK
jgi:KaiC/GvpD/RAD55 family RecA-like ATPase